MRGRGPIVNRKSQIANPGPFLRAEAAPGELLLSALATVDLVAAGDNKSGKRPTFSMMAYSGGLLRLAGWYRPVVIDLGGLRAAEPIAALLDHDPAQLLGQSTSVKIDPDGVSVAGIITGDDEPAQKVLAHARNGFQWKVSIGTSVDKLESVAENTIVKVNGKEFTGPILVVRAATLREASFVSMGADEKAGARIAAQRAAAEEQHMDKFEKFVKAMGLVLAELPAERQTTLKAWYDQLDKQGLVAEDGTVKAKAPAAPAAGGGGNPSDRSNPSDPATVQAAAVADLRAAQAAEVKRFAAIHKACAGYPEIEAKAVEGNWSADKAELEVLRASRPKAPAIHSIAAAPSGASVLEAALCLDHRIGTEPQLLAAHGEKVLTEANRFRRIGLRKTVEICAGLRGVELPLAVDSNYVRAAFSNTDLGGILGNVANKALAANFLAARAVLPLISRPVSHVNFHAHTVYSLALSGDLEEVAPDGKLKSLALSEESYTRQVKTRGAVLSISRQDLINDELGAFVDNAARLGRKAVVSRERAGFLLVNSTGNGGSFFTAAHGNYFAGATTNLQLSSLTTAVQMFRDQTGPDGDPVMINPRILLVPTALEETAKALMDRSAALIAVALGSTSAEKRAPSANVWAGQFDVQVSEWLAKTIGTQAGSATAWHLLADPADVAAIEIAYLNGLQTPTVEYFGMDQEADTLGVIWRVFWDFGVALAEYRAGVKSKGKA